MNAGATSERVYAGLKRRILERQFRPGDRLDPALLAAALLSSVTPVRDALHRLTGEGLVEARTSEGFHLPAIDAPSLLDLYSWNAEVLVLAVRSWRPVPSAPAIPSRGGAAENTAALADTAAALFAVIAARSANVEHRAAIASANDRLHAARLAEAKVLGDLEAEHAALETAVLGGEADTVRASIAAYHRRRRRHTDEVVWTLYRNGGHR